MSHSTYNKKWAEAHTELLELQDMDEIKEPALRPKDRDSAYQHIAVLYVKHIQVYRKLEDAYDQIVHPQKRLTLATLLNGVIGRIIEYKHILVDLEQSDFLHFDNILQDLKLTPYDLEIPVPRHVKDVRYKELEEREKVLDELGAVYDSSRKEDMEEIVLTFDEAVILIQRHERARQGRLRAKFMKEIRDQEEREKRQMEKNEFEIEPDDAATTIQKHFRAFRSRKSSMEMRMEELSFIGMVHGSKDKLKEEVKKCVRTEKKRKTTQRQNALEYEQALITIKKKIEEVEGPDIKENMQDQIRQWFIDQRDLTGKFPDFPDEDAGGSKVIFDMINGVVPEEPPEEENPKDKKGKKGKDDKAKKNDKKKGKGGDDEDDDGLLKFPVSKFVPNIKNGLQEYMDIWETRDESGNVTQQYDVELVKAQKRGEIEEEIREQVDDLMRDELYNLKAALDRDAKKGKGKKGKGKKGKGKKGKGKGKGKGKKGKKEKDLTEDRTIEDIYAELVKAGIVIDYEKTKLSDFKGQHSLLSTSIREARQNPDHSLPDVARILTEYCILPMVTEEVHETCPHIKSVLLAGPTGVGKNMLLRALATELGANIFDLTPANTVGKYEGKSGITMMLHMVFKLAKKMQPSVIMIDRTERIFAKKLPKDDMTEPKRIKKDLIKAVKGLKPGHRVLLVGLSTAPMDGDLKTMLSVYQKTIIIPRPDYGSREILWREFLEQADVEIGLLDTSSLAKISEGYTPGQMLSVVHGLLTERRRAQLKRKPLQCEEFIAELAKMEPIYAEDFEVFKSWFAKTPLGKKRNAILEDDGEDEDDGKKGKGKDKKGGGKKKK
eukprot:Nk52_evm31s294 gene=Nk52_evmTU31s294